MSSWMQGLSILALSLSVGCGAHVRPSAQHASLGHAVSLSLPTDAGELASIPANGPSVTVADFFTPTCKPCREKVPALWARKGEVEAAGGALVLVAVVGDGESTTDVREALAGWGLPDAPFLVDAGDASSREAGVRDLPATLIVDASSVVRWVAPTDATASEVVAAVRKVAGS